MLNSLPIPDRSDPVFAQNIAFMQVLEQQTFDPKQNAEVHYWRGVTDGLLRNQEVTLEKQLKTRVHAAMLNCLRAGGQIREDAVLSVGGPRG